MQDGDVSAGIKPSATKGKTMGERIISGVHIILGRKFSHLVFMWRGVRHDVSVWTDIERCRLGGSVSGDV